MIRELRSELRSDLRKLTVHHDTLADTLKLAKIIECKIFQHKARVSGMKRQN